MISGLASSPGPRAARGFSRCMGVIQATTGARAGAGDYIGAASPATAAGAGLAMGSLAIAAASAGLLATVAVAIGFAGVLVAGLAIWHVVTRSDIPVVVRSAYSLLLVALIVAGLAGGLAVIAQGKEPLASERSQDARGGSNAVGGAK